MIGDKRVPREEWREVKRGRSVKEGEEREGCLGGREREGRRKEKERTSVR